MKNLAFGIFLSGCGLLEFDIESNIPEQRIAGNPLGGLLPGFLQAAIPLNIDLRAETQKRDTGPASAAFLKALSFQVTPHDSPTGNFDFIDEIHIFIAARDDTTLMRVEIASLRPVPKNQTKLDLNVAGNIDLLPYINKGAEITSTASGRQPARDVTFDGKVVITVKI